MAGGLFLFVLKIKKTKHGASLWQQTVLKGKASSSGPMWAVVVLAASTAGGFQPHSTLRGATAKTTEHILEVGPGSTLADVWLIITAEPDGKGDSTCQSGLFF